MKIAYHNPHHDASGSRAFKHLRDAGRSLGLGLFDCADERDIDACNPDFVLSVSTEVAKIVDRPSYLALLQPKAQTLEDPGRLKNILSYDGYLTVSDSLARFVGDFSHGLGSIEAAGFFRPTPRRSDLRFDWGRRDFATNLKVVYCGTNQAGDMPILFRALSPTGILRSHGPAGDWAGFPETCYRGAIPSDMHGPQRCYAAGGIGLALPSQTAQREDLVNHRIFDIVSVGALAICPDLPWIRRWFGDSVLYFEADRPQRQIAHGIQDHYARVLADPDRARDMANAARDIFERHFAAERMLANLVAYHARKTADHARRIAAMPPPPRVSVIIRCGGRDIASVARAIDSLRNQCFGQFTVILAKYQPIDLSAVTVLRGDGVAEFEEFLIPGGGRATMLFEGVRRVKTVYFAVLDDDDFLLSTHFEALFRAGWRVRPDFDVAFSGVVDVVDPVRADTVVPNRAISRFGFTTVIRDAGDIHSVIHLCCFVARRDLITDDMLEIPNMRTAEDSLLVSYISWRSKPIFSFKPTAFYKVDSADGSNWQRDYQRREDELSLVLRGGLAWAPQWLAVGSLAQPIREIAQVRTALGHRHLGEYIDRMTLSKPAAKTSEGVIVFRGQADQICASPALELPAGEYEVIGLVDMAGEASHAAAIGQIEVVALWGNRVLGSADFGQDRPEPCVGFMVDGTLARQPVGFRVLATGDCGFAVRSLSLHAATAPRIPTETAPGAHASPPPH